MPAEWEQHAATWLTWPRPNGISFPGRYKLVPPVLAKLVKLISEGETIHINIWDKELELLAKRSLEKENVPMKNIHFHPFQAYEPWCRDHGPMFIAQPNGNQAIVNWGYNAWGEKYPPFDLDDSIPGKVATARRMTLFEPKMILEGGSIEVNGNDSLITTEQCILNKNRNPNLNKQEIESRLINFVGIKNITWLGNGIEGDDTDGHVDNLTRFASENTVVTAVEPNTSDPNHMPLQINRNKLKQKFNVAELPMPRKIEYKGQRLPASYANFYISNAHIIVPTYQDPNDDRALDILSDMFPSRTVTGLDSMELIWGLGSFHCLTQQEPA
jgi:agmatine deiminase